MTAESPTGSNSPILAGIDRMIALAEEEASALHQQVVEGASGALRGVPDIAGDVGPSLTDRIDRLDLVVDRLRKIKEWLTQDPRMLPLVDDYIGQQVRAMETRQATQNVRLAVITTVVGVVLGWAISLAGTPATLLHVFGH